MDKQLERIKAFGMTNCMMSADLTKIATEYGIDLGHTSTQTEQIKEKYYPQFNASIRAEAKIMSDHYELFYCLERSIRDIVSNTIESAVNDQDWWSKGRIPIQITQDVALRIQKEVDSGVTQRSSEELDYTTFGELSQIIDSNWDLFGSILRSKKAVNRVLTSLNTLRGPIAHCSILSEDEVLRLNLSVRDWYRQME